MNKNILSIIITSTLLSGVAYGEGTDKKLVFYRDLAEYKESGSVEPEDGSNFKIDLTDTAVLSSFNVVMKKEGKDILPSSIEVHEKSEENIFKLNKHKKVFVNNTEYILEENGFGFIKLRNKDGYVTYIPKDKIELISFENDISSTKHIAKINLRDKFETIDVDYSYMIGMLSWKPSYKFYIKNKNKLQLDYFVEVNNKTLNTFKDVKMEVVVDNTPKLLNKDFLKSENDGIFGDIKREEGLEEKNDNRLRGLKSEGYSSNGYDYYKKPTKRIEESVEVFSLPSEITLSPKSISKHLYIDTKEIEYKKENELDDPAYSLYENKDNVFETTSTLIIPNKEGILYQKGIGSLYSKDKLNKDKVLLKEYKISEGKKNKEFELYLGQNKGLYVEAISMDTIYSKNDLLIYNNKEELLEKKEILEKGYDANEYYYPTSFSIKINKVVLKANNKGNEDELILNRDKGYFFNINNIEKVKSILSEYELLTLKEKTLKKKENVIDELKTYYLNDETSVELDLMKKFASNEIQYSQLTFNLKNSDELVYYKLFISEEGIDVSRFNTNYNSRKDILKEQDKFDKYIEQL